MTIESKLFEWEAWDPMDALAAQFYNCTTKVKIGDIPAGEHFYGIAIDNDESHIRLTKIDERGVVTEERTFELSYVVGEEK